MIYRLTGTFGVDYPLRYTFTIKMSQCVKKCKILTKNDTKMYKRIHVPIPETGTETLEPGSTLVIGLRLKGVKLDYLKGLKRYLHPHPKQLNTLTKQTNTVIYLQPRQINNYILYIHCALETWIPMYIYTLLFVT